MDEKVILEKYNIKIRKFLDSSSLFRITVPLDVGKVIFAFSEFVGMYEVDL